ncbi:hypothetical protein LINGRAHAP2_LOCUS38326, partial [Linum grandiflorum]
MCRPSQTPHLTMSSARIGPPNGLWSKRRGSAPPPFHGISKITLKVVVFQFCRSSHLYYTSQVISQSRTRVKLNRGAWAAATIRVGPHPEPIGGPAFAVPHPTGAHRRPPSASLPTISS